MAVDADLKLKYAILLLILGGKLMRLSYINNSISILPFPPFCRVVLVTSLMK